MTDHNDDDQRWLETVLKGLDERSDAVKQALMKAVEEREGAGPLLHHIWSKMGTLPSKRGSPFARTDFDPVIVIRSFDTFTSDTSIRR